jgi:glycosyltransferase involved in cell wall biosynthesis
MRIASLVIPARNEAGRLGFTLDAAQRALSAAELANEIIVVDNGSSDATASVAERHGASVLDARDAETVAAVRNRGARRALGDIVCFLDADVLVNERWALRVKERLASCTEGRWLSGNECTAGDSSSWIQRTWFAVSGRDRSHVNAANMVVPRVRFLEIGGFDERLSSGEDYEICLRARALGWAVTADELLEARHMRDPASLFEFAIRELWHGSGDFQSWATFQSSKIAWIVVLLWLAAAMALPAGLALRSPWPLLGPVALLGAASVLAAIVRRKKRPADVAPLALLYVVFFLARAASPAAALAGSRGDLWRRARASRVRPDAPG